jgi:peptidoglycan/xylan/chitin deacetylase (PgdA/CDA1 family)
VNAKDIAKLIAFRVLGSKPVAAWRMARIGTAGRVIVLNLHRVAPDDGSAFRPLAPEIFRETIRFLKRHCHLATFADLPSYDGGRPAAILSFDDGYKDFVEYAVPIMEEFSVRANLNVIPSAIESGLPPLNVMVQDLVGKLSPHVLRDRFMDVAGVDISKSAVSVSASLKNRPMAEQQKIAEIVVPEMMSISSYEPTPMMTVEDIRGLVSECEIGVHSYYHATMSEETDDYLRRDANDCVRYCKERLDFIPKIYAFPNGAYRDSQVDILVEAGFESILLVENGFSSKDSTVHPRFNFDARSVREGRFRGAGGLARISRSRE